MSGAGVVAARQCRATCVPVVVGLVALASAVWPTPASATQRARSQAAITPAALLAAVVQPSDLSGILGGDAYATKWTPGDPEVHTARADRTPVFEWRGLVAMAARHYYGGQASAGHAPLPRVESVLLLFDKEAAAKSEFTDLRDKLKPPQGEKDGATVDGPAVGDEYRYFDRYRRDTGEVESTVRFRIGRVVGRVSLFAEPRYDDRPPAAASTDAVHIWVEPVVAHVRAMFDGSLQVPAVPRETAKRLPPAAAAPGPVLFRSVEPVEAWGLPGDPQIQRLEQLGAGAFAQQNYGLRGRPGAGLSVALLTFPDPGSAKTWQRDFASDVDHPDRWKQLEHGRTGTASTFGSRIGSSRDGNRFGYELQFAAGNYVGDVSCGAFAGRSPRACESAVRKLAQTWYAHLNAR